MKSTWCLTVVVLLSAAASRATAQGPVSEYYLTAGDQQMMHVVQGGAVVRSWNEVSGNREYPVAVLDDVRTAGGSGGESGARYDLDGNDLGDRYPYPNGVGSHWDGTTDGVFNYTVDFSSGGVWRFNPDWTGGVQIFSTPTQYLGITYDPTDNTMWISQWNGTRVEHRDMSGNVLGGFDAATNSISCLALDHADGTLWMGSQSTQGTFRQYSKSGQLLQTVNYPGLVDQNTLGGEFQFGGVGCVYTVKKSKSKRGCETCPERGSDYRTQAECEDVKDCAKKVKTTIACPQGGNGICKIKGKRSSCG